MSCGSGGVRDGASVQLPKVRVAWLLLWFRGVPSGAAGWWIPHGELLAPCVFQVGVSRKKELWSVARPPCHSLTLLGFWAAGNVSLAPFSQVTCAEAAPGSQAFNVLGGGARRLRWRTYLLTLALESNVLDNLLITLPWSAASPWVSRIWLPPWPGPWCARLVGEEG